MHGDIHRFVRSWNDRGVDGWPDTYSLVVNDPYELEARNDCLIDDVQYLGGGLQNFFHQQSLVNSNADGALLYDAGQALKLIGYRFSNKDHFCKKQTFFNKLNYDNLAFVLHRNWKSGHELRNAVVLMQYNTFYL